MSMSYLTLRLKHTTKSGHAVTTSGAFFASAELAALLKLHKCDVQIIQADTRYFNGKNTEKTYFLVHAEQRLSCFDYQQSEYAGKALVLERLAQGEHPDSFLVKGVRSVVIDEKCAADADFFFLKNVVLVDPIVSETLAKSMLNDRLKVHLEELVIQ